MLSDGPENNIVQTSLIYFVFEESFLGVNKHFHTFRCLIIPGLGMRMILFDGKAVTLRGRNPP